MYYTYLYSKVTYLSRNLCFTLIFQTKKNKIKKKLNTIHIFLKKKKRILRISLPKIQEYHRFGTILYTVSGKFPRVILRMRAEISWVAHARPNGGEASLFFLRPCSQSRNVDVAGSVVEILTLDSPIVSIPTATHLVSPCVVVYFHSTPLLTPRPPPPPSSSSFDRLRRRN